jgi:hypothetical protein
MSQPINFARKPGTAHLSAAGDQLRVFTEAECRWLTANWATRTYEALMTHLRCSVRVLKREAARLGLKPRTEKVAKKASDFRTKRKYNKNPDKIHRGCEKVKDIDGEKSSPPPEGILYACPGCGMRALEAIGHEQCLAKVA